ncbi:MAG TPA: histidine kinase [Candidatus Limnocylindria bacterium]|nr:histidine kinase [Candidatus Limnocylindria bacterium]
MDTVLTNPRRKQVRALNAAVAQATEAERERVRKVLHDGLGQLLTSISFLAGSLRQKLAERELPEAGEAAEILLLTTQAISETQRLLNADLPKPTGQS